MTERRFVDVVLVKPKCTVLQMLESGNLLEGQPILQRVHSIHADMPYRLGNDTPMMPAEVLKALYQMTAEIPQLRLQPVIVPGEENAYHIDLTLSYSQVLTHCQQVLMHAVTFSGHLRAIQARVASVRPKFGVWWKLAAREFLELNPTYSDLLPDKSLDILAADECSVALHEQDIEVAAVLDAVSMLIVDLKSEQKQAEITYQLGKDQINASLSDSRIPNTAVSGSAPKSLQRKPSSAIQTLARSFPGRVAETLPPTQVDEDELPAALLAPVPAEEVHEVVAPVSVDVEAPDALDAGVPPPPEAREIIPVDTTPQFHDVSVVNVATDPTTALDLNEDAGPDEAPHEVEAPEVTPPPVVATPRKKGEAVVVSVNVDIKSPGISGVYGGVILGRGKTKLCLTSQAVVAENGVYRFMGADQPLIRLADEVKSKVVQPEDDVPPVHDVPPEEPTSEVETIVPPPVTEVTEPVIAADPFAKMNVTVPVRTKDPNVKASVQTPFSDPVDVAVKSSVAPLSLDDEDDLFSGNIVVQNQTAAVKPPEEVAPEPPVAEVPPTVEAAPVKPLVITPATGKALPEPAPAAAASVLFRTRGGAAPGTAVTAKPFVLPTAPAANLDAVL